MSKNRLLGGLVCLALFGILWGIRGSVLAADKDAPTGAAEDKRPHVEVSLPARKTLYRRLEVPGDILPDQQAAIYARVSGYLESVPVDRGSLVKSGDALASIAVPELERKRARQQAELKLCAPSQERDRATLAWREVAWKRLEELREKSPHLVSQESLEESLGRYEVARAEHALTRAREDVLRAEIAETETMIGFSKLCAPFDGIVTERWGDAGDFVQMGTTKLFRVMKMDPIRVRIAVPQSDALQVRADSIARISIRELPGRTVESKVSRLFWALNPATKTMWVEIDIPNTDLSIRPGMFASVKVDLEAHPDVLVVPAAAIVSEKKKTFVYVVSEGVAKKTPVVLGVDTGIEVEIRKGIDAGDEVIVSGKNLVSDKTPVRTTRVEYK
ncbi:MAG: efflux RND transporter periplasmic adaptor subunit [Planctomycetes bacterium]|nr:efflux RND transporter periplasmic adaptor subunit [Planctomycetota bacterium]